MYYLNSSFNLTEIQSLFKTFDKNNDKYISGEELGKAMRFLGLNVTKKDVQEAMKVLDKNGMISSILNLHFCVTDNSNIILQHMSF